MMRILYSFVVYQLIFMCSAQTLIDFTPAKNDSLPSLTTDAHMSTTTTKSAPFTCHYEMVQCKGPEHRCIFIFQLCNNRRDCPLGDDEDDCSDRSGDNDNEDDDEEKKPGWQPWHFVVAMVIFCLCGTSIFVFRKFYRPCSDLPSAPPQNMSTTVTITSHQEDGQLLFGESGDRQPPRQQLPSVNNDPQSTDLMGPPPSYSEATGMA